MFRSFYVIIIIINIYDDKRFCALSVRLIVEGVNVTRPDDIAYTTAGKLRYDDMRYAEVVNKLLIKSFRLRLRPFAGSPGAIDFITRRCNYLLIGKSSEGVCVDCLSVLC